jgi:predicted small lipoprotein YifL
MKRALLLALAFVFIFSGCGKKGAILPPVALVPQAPEILSLVQQGDQAVLEWKNPVSYMDGEVLPGLASVEIWRAEVGEEEAAEPAAVSREKFQDRAALQAVIRQPEFIKLRSGGDKQAGPLRASLSLGGEVLSHKMLSYALRAIDSRRKKSQFSEIRTLQPKPLPRPPFNLRAEVEAEGVILCWDSPRENFDGSVLSGLAGYRVLRAENGSSFKLLTAEPVPEICFRDGQIVFGQTYFYAVRAAAAGSEPFDESRDSLPLEVTPRDTFPPAPPSGLTALPGDDFISLAWDPRPETDLAGYRVWRREEGGLEFGELTSQLLVETTYLDRTAEKNKRYEYAVTAEDKTGNRSPFSAGVVESLKGNR